MAERGSDRSYGQAAVVKALRGMDFPCSKQEVLSHAGSQEVEYRKGERLSLRDIIDRVRQDRFKSPADLESAISDVM